MQKEVDAREGNDISKELDVGFEGLARVMAAYVEQDAEPSSLEPLSVKIEKTAEQITESLLSFKTMLEEGAIALEKEITDLVQTDLSLKKEEVIKDIEKLNVYLAEIDLHAEEVDAAMQKGTGLFELVKMNQSSFEALFLAANQLYNRGEYKAVAGAFSILTLLEPRYSSLWISMGNAEYFCQDYERALTAYAVAVYVDPDDPSPYLYSAKCYEELHDIDTAINSLDLALFVIQNDPTKKELQ